MVTANLPNVAAGAVTALNVAHKRKAPAEEIARLQATADEAAAKSRVFPSQASHG